MLVIQGPGDLAGDRAALGRSRDHEAMDVVGLDTVRERQATPSDDAIDVARVRQVPTTEHSQPDGICQIFRRFLAGGAGLADAAGNADGKAAVSGRSIRRNGGRVLLAVALKAFPQPSCSDATRRLELARQPVDPAQLRFPALDVARQTPLDQGAAPGAPGQRRLRLVERMPMRRQQVLDHRFTRVGLKQLQKAELQACARRCQPIPRAGRSASAAAAPCTPGQRGKDATPPRRRMAVARG